MNNRHSSSLDSSLEVRETQIQICRQGMEVFFLFSAGTAYCLRSRRLTVLNLVESLRYPRAASFWHSI
jgi:hypothetical protein